MGAAQFQGTQDYFQYRYGLLKYLIVPESDNPIPLSFNPTVTTLIIRTAFLVLSSIEFDHNFRLETCKIRDIAGNRNLPAEPVTAELPAPQMLPKMAFSIRGPIP